VKSIGLQSGEVIILVFKTPLGVGGNQLINDDYFLVVSDGLERLSPKAHQLGEEAGASSGEQVFAEAEVTRGWCKQLLVGLDEGDSDVLEALPQPDLSGEWADGNTASKLLGDLGVTESLDAEDQTSEAQMSWDDMESHLCDLWCDGFRDGLECRVRQLALAFLDRWQSKESSS